MAVDLADLKAAAADLIDEAGDEILQTVLDEVEGHGDLTDQDGDLYADDKVTEDEITEGEGDDAETTTIQVLVDADDPHTVVADAWRAGRDAVLDVVRAAIETAKNNV